MNAPRWQLTTAHLKAFLALSVIGLALSLIAHTVALLGLPQPLGPLTWALHGGIFAVWLPAVIVCKRLVVGFPRKDFWRAALRGCPAWMRWTTFVVFGYAVVNFLLFIKAAPPRGAGAPVNEALEIRGFSGHWMAFYSAAAAILYSAIAIAKSDPNQRLPNGRPLPPSMESRDSPGTAAAETTDWAAERR
jgi:hypothetical protein